MMMARNQGVACMFAVALVLATIPAGVQSIGVCYGVHGDRMPTAAEVVQMYRSNGFTNMRIYFADTNALKTLSGTNIGLIMDIDNVNVAKFARDPSAAKTWVQDNVKAFPGVNFRYITVGNEVTGSDAQLILPAMKNVNAALAAAGLGNIKVSTAVNSGVTAGFPPSQGTFNSVASSYMTPVAQYLATTGAPLLANIYPYFAYHLDKPNNPIDYALFKWPGAKFQDPNGNRNYQNLFDALVDTMYSALESAGAGSVKIVLSESGWPSAGDDVGATKANAQTYNQNLVNHVGKGTPKRPGAIEAYIFAMFDENQKPGEETERHFGLFNPIDKSPVYHIDF